MKPRLISSLFVNALLRLADRDGGFGAVLSKGDQTAGAVLILLVERGGRQMLLERLLQPDGDYAWETPMAAGANADDVNRFLARRRQFDPDCWVVELDIASVERFAAEIRSLD